MLNQFVGYVSARDLPDGKIELVQVTDFGSPFCDRMAFDHATRQPTVRPQGQAFVVSRQEFEVLHKHRISQ